MSENFLRALTRATSSRPTGVWPAATKVANLCTNDGNSVLVLATFSEPQRLCLVVPASSSLSQCDGQWRAARRALPGRFAAQWPCEGCGRLALPILLTCRSAPRGPVAESSGGAEIERARFGRRGWTCHMCGRACTTRTRAAARARIVARRVG